MDISSKDFCLYQREAWRRAWRETWKFSPINQKQAIFTFLTLIATWIVAFQLGIQEELLNALGILTIGLPLIIGLSFLISHRIMAPAYMLSDVRHERDRLQERLCPKLRLEYDGGESYQRPEGKYRTLAFISVHNDSDVTISDIDVTCDEIMAISMDADRVPIRTIGSRHTFTLHGGKREFIRVLYHDLDATNRPGIIEVTLRSPYRSDHRIEGEGFHLKIGAGGTDISAEPIRLTCYIKNRKLYVHRDS